MPEALPPRANLDWLKKTAKQRHAARRAADPAAKLADAQLDIARAYGFSSWRALKAHLDHPPAEEIPETEIAAFLRAVAAGDAGTIASALAASPSFIHARGPHPYWGGRPQALHLAVESKRRAIFDLILAAGADVNGANDEYEHWSPLMLALHARQDAMRDELIARGARIGLVEAMLMGDDARVETLLRDGVLPSLRPNHGSLLAFARTPFAIDRLLELGVSAVEKDRWGATPIEAMSRQGETGRDLVRHLMLRGFAAEPQEFARLNDRQTLEALIAADPAIAKRDVVMMAAVDFGHHDLVRWLIAKGANPNARAPAQSRHTALHAAAWNGDLAMVALLLEAGADPSLRDEEHNATPCGWAETSIEISKNQKCADVVAFLRERGAPS